VESKQLFQLVTIFLALFSIIYCESRSQELSVKEELIYQSDWYFNNERGTALPFVISLNNRNGNYFDFKYDLIDFGYTASKAYAECKINSKCFIVHEYNNVKYIDASFELVDADTLRTIYISSQGAGNLYKLYARGKIPPQKHVTCQGCILKKIKKGSIKINE
jgi:hypothetical protein